VRQSFAEACLVLKGRKYIWIFLAKFIQSEEVNPVMAVETARLTKDAHERLLREELRRRRIACIQVLGDLGVQYYREPFGILGVEKAEQPLFVQQSVVGALESVLEDKDQEVAAAAQQALKAVNAARGWTQGAGDAEPASP